MQGNLGDLRLEFFKKGDAFLLLHLKTLESHAGFRHPHDQPELAGLFQYWPPRRGIDHIGANLANVCIPYASDGGSSDSFTVLRG
jgi:hypothetical protein